MTNVQPIVSKLFTASRFGNDLGRVPIHRHAMSTGPSADAAPDGCAHTQQSPHDESDRRNALVLENLHLVKTIATRVRGSLPVHIDLDDLIQAGTIGLMDAAKKFDDAKQVAFSAYAKHRIKGAILDSLREMDEASRDLRRLDKEVGCATRSLTDSLQREPDEVEIAERLGMSVEKLRAKLLCIRSVARVSTSARTDEDAPLLESPTSPETYPDATYAKKEMRGAIRMAMNGLSRNEQKVLLLYYTDERKMREIGDMLGVNESRISQIHKRAIQKMEVQLRTQGITSA